LGPTGRAGGAPHEQTLSAQRPPPPAPQLAVAIKHHIAAFQALHRRCVNSIRGMGAGAAPLVDAVEAWWASLPASKGDAVDVAAEGAAAVASADAAAAAAASASDVSASVALADTTAPLLSPEALGGEANAGEAKRLLLTMRQLQERVSRHALWHRDLAARWHGSLSTRRFGVEPCHRLPILPLAARGDRGGKRGRGCPALQDPRQRGRRDGCSQAFARGGG